MSGVPEIQQDKAVLRTRLRAARSSLSADERRDAGRLIRDALLDLPELQMAGTVAAYYSVGAEPDTRGEGAGLSAPAAAAKQEQLAQHHGHSIRQPSPGRGWAAREPKGCSAG